MSPNSFRVLNWIREARKVNPQIVYCPPLQWWTEQAEFTRWTITEGVLHP